MLDDRHKGGRSYIDARSNATAQHLSSACTVRRTFQRARLCLHQVSQAFAAIGAPEEDLIHVWSSLDGDHLLSIGIHTRHHPLQSGYCAPVVCCPAQNQSFLQPFEIVSFLPVCKAGTQPGRTS